MTPFIIHKLGFPISKISEMFGLAGVAFLVGSILAGVIVNKRGVFSTAMLGVVCILFAGVSSLVVYSIFGLTLWGFFTPCFFATFGCALTAGSGASGSMEPFYEIAGVAAAMFGTMEFAISGVIGSIAMIFPATSNLPIAIAMIIMSSIAMILLILVNFTSLGKTNEKV
jgi:DHA1 family florfenicol/chloramphenicol resistance protein-like MFS transporter